MIDAEFDPAGAHASPRGAEHPALNLHDLGFLIIGEAASIFAQFSSPYPK
jgi:hypothetical protein